MTRVVVTKKGSPAWRAKVGKAQKKAWKARKQKARARQAVAATDDKADLNLKHAKQATFAYEPPFNPEEFLNIKPLGVPPPHRKWQLETEAAPFHITPEVVAEAVADNKTRTTNPKTLTGNSKVPVLSVVPPASIIAQGTAMRYGAYFAPKVDGTKGYGPYNWRDQPIEAHIYIDAAMRHLMQWWDGDDNEIVLDDKGEVVDLVSHLAFALATIGILIDAKASSTLLDDRPKSRIASATYLLGRHKLRNQK